MKLAGETAANLVVATGEFPSCYCVLNQPSVCLVGGRSSGRGWRGKCLGRVKARRDRSGPNKQDLGDRIMRGCVPRARSKSRLRRSGQDWATRTSQGVSRRSPFLSQRPLFGFFSPLLELPNPLSEMRGALPIGEQRPAGGRPLRAERTKGPVHVYRSSSTEVVVGPSYSLLAACSGEQQQLFVFCQSMDTKQSVLVSAESFVGRGWGLDNRRVSWHLK